MSIHKYVYAAADAGFAVVLVVLFVIMGVVTYNKAVSGGPPYLSQVERDIREHEIAARTAIQNGDHSLALTHYKDAAVLSLEEWEKGEPYYCLLYKQQYHSGSMTAVSQCMASLHLCNKFATVLGDDLLRECLPG